MSAPTITVTPTTVVFGEQQDLGTSTQAVETLVFDANGDGLQDLVLNGRNSNTISLMLNQGDGSFGAATTIATGSQWHIYNGDIDGDGNQDVLMTRWNEDYSEQTLGYLKNNGDGTFGAFETLETGFRNILDVTTVDFDGDGDLDVLTAGSGDAGVMIAKNNGDGTFTKSLLATGTSVYSVSTGDINGDGILDVVTTDGSGTLKAFTIGADGQSTQTHTVNLDPIYPAESVELVDLDGDGALDAVVANSNRKELSWLKGNGDGTFGPKQTIADGNEQSPYVTGFRVVDVNGDGRLDIIAGSPRTVGETAQTQQSYLSWFEQEADGTFTEHMTNVKYPSEADFFDVNYGDLNNDGVIDLISAGPVSIGGSRNYVRFATGMEAIEVAENAPTALHGIAFSDDSTGAVEVTLSVDRGTLEATSAAGVTVSGSGSGSQVVLTGTIADINAFLENDGVLFTTANNDETSAKLNITINDQDPLNPSVVSKTIGLAVTPADDLSPVEVELSGDTVAEDAAIGTLIGTLSATDPEGGPVTYSLYSGGQYVTLDGNQLKLNTALDFEGQSSFQIIVRATDEGGAFTDQTLTIDVTNANEAPLSIALSKLLVPQSSAAGTVVGDLTTTDPDSGDTFTYSIPGGSEAFDIVDNKLVVKDLSGALIHDVKVLATDSGGLTVEKSFRITTTDDDGNPLGSAGTITIDASNAASMDFEAYIRGGFLAGTVGGGMPVFDNGGAFSGSEVMMAYGSDTASKYVLARGSMEYYFATHTIWGEIGTIEYGTRGNGAYDSSGSFQGGAAELRITGLSLSNNKPTGADEAEIEANGPVHNFTVAHMYGDIGSTARIGVYSDSLDAYAQNYIGSAGADVFTGTVFADTINGGAGDDTLNGGGGNDTIRIGSGNDIVDGGDGIDTVIVDGNFADYNLLALSTIYLTENASGEMDRIRTTEYIKFKDALYNVATQEVTPIEDLAPTGLDISAKTVSENVAIGTVVGTFSATDPEGGALAYTLTSDAGGLFRLDGAKLVTAKAIDYEKVKSATVTVEVSDGVNIVAESFTIGVTDVNEAPTALSLSKSSVAENAKVGTVVGTLSAKDPEGGAVSYSLSSNPGGIFKVVGNQLQLAKAVDYETARS
ncbi:FG-GAP-like repeat-containing protein, partial [Rhizobium sp. TRM96647]|uniref:FG-GAP-like repeat-containing protein n=1 Tax=unclassified Rhizobium TaxID=2613769 RepID=UPI0021E7B9E8